MQAFKRSTEWLNHSRWPAGRRTFASEQKGCSAFILLSKMLAVKRMAFLAPFHSRESNVPFYKQNSWPRVDIELLRDYIILATSER